MMEQIFKTPAQAREDARLVALCRQGDAAAWETLLGRYELLICAVPRRAGLDEENVAEVFQEVVVTLLEKMPVLEQPERLRAWLVTTAKYKTWGVLKRLGKYRHEVSGETADLALYAYADPALRPDEALAEAEEQHLIRTALLSLEERCRTILRMLFYTEEPRPYPEIAAAIGVAASSVGPLRARCLKRLERLLSK